MFENSAFEIDHNTFMVNYFNIYLILKTGSKNRNETEVEAKLEIFKDL